MEFRKKSKYMRTNCSLFIETSTERSFIGYTREGAPAYQKEFSLGLNNSKYLASSVHEGLEALQISSSELQYIAVGIGPGSYTGIRVGAMMAKALAFASKVPLIGISTLECFRPQNEGPFATVIDAKIGGFYVITGLYQKQTCIFTSAPKIVTLEEMGNLLENVERIISPNLLPLQNKLQPHFSHLTWEECSPSLLQMMETSQRQWQSGNISLDGSLNLLYLRKTQAEIEKQKS